MTSRIFLGSDTQLFSEINISRLFGNASCCAKILKPLCVCEGQLSLKGELICGSVRLFGFVGHLRTGPDYCVCGHASPATRQVSAEWLCRVQQQSFTY